MPCRMMLRCAWVIAGLAFTMMLLSACSWLRLVEDGRAGKPDRTATATPPIVMDCTDPVFGLGPCPAGNPPVTATTLTCSVAFVRTSGVLRWRISARLTLTADGQPVAGQPVHWTLPQGLAWVERAPGGGAPVTTTNQAGLAVLEVTETGSTYLGRSLVQASFTDLPPHAGRSRILGPSSCSTGVPVPYPPLTPTP